MALLVKGLGGIGKTVIGAGGAVVKGGARLFGDDAVKAVGSGVGKLQNGIDDVIQHAVKQDEIYKTAKSKARKVKEANKGSGSAAKDAINASSKSKSQKANASIEGQMSMNFDDSGNITGYTEDIIEKASFFDNVVEKWDGLPGWAKTTSIATAGVIAGAVLFDDDDE